MKTLSTAEMLDALGLEDVAINQEGNHVGYSHKGDLLMWFKGEEKPGVAEGNRYEIHYPFFKKDRWTINHHQIDFEEAMDYLTEQNRSVIYCHDNGNEYVFHPSESKPFAKLTSESIQFKDLRDGKWRVV